MSDLAVPLFIAALFVTPVHWLLVVFFFRALSSREPGVYEQLGRPNLTADRNMAIYVLGKFLLSNGPEKLGDRQVYYLANTLRVLTLVLIACVIPLLYRLIIGRDGR